MTESAHGFQTADLDDARTPAHVLTGFLGSGKTTLLRSLLANEALADTAVVINEFGEVGLDHLLVRELAEDIVLLSSGCICCVVGDDLAATLEELHAMMRDGQIPFFSRLVIETTGMADPAPIMHAIMGDQRVTGHYRLGQVLSTVDAINGEATLHNHFEARQQLAAADRIILTKTDLVAKDEVSILTKKLTATNPSAPVSVSAEGRFPAAEILENLDRIWTTGKNLDLLDHGHSDSHSHGAHHHNGGHHAHHHHDHDGHHHGHDHPHEVHSFTIRLDRPLNWARFVDWLELLLRARGHDILRVKGILKVDDKDDAVVIQGVQHMLYPVELFPGHTDDSGWIVFIAQNMTKEAIETSIASIYES